jgi:hypothetical protein
VLTPVAESIKEFPFLDIRPRKGHQHFYQSAFVQVSPYVQTDFFAQAISFKRPSLKQLAKVGLDRGWSLKRVDVVASWTASEC